MSPSDDADLAHVLQRIRRHLVSGTLRYSGHGRMRMDQRRINEQDVRTVLESGRLDNGEKAVRHHEHYGKSYAILGEDIDRRPLRIVVSFHGGCLHIVTAMIQEERP